MAPTADMKVLDIGGKVDPSGIHGLQLIDSYPWKNMISAINLSENDIATIKRTCPEVEAVVGDACKLPWPTNHFDIVYSNAVIEHLGSLEKQKKMADEIARVGKRWFICTPNRWYLFEFHMRLPFVTWLPGNTYLRIGRFLSYSHAEGKYVSGVSRNDLRLLSAKELSSCFPGSRIIKQRITFMPETLIVVGEKRLSG
jgi:hypothetical protein